MNTVGFIKTGLSDTVRAGTLSKALSPRVIFNPRDQQHLREYAAFIKHRRWRNGCRFLLEDPYTDIPSMISNKLAAHFLRKYIDEAK